MLLDPEKLTAVLNKVRVIREHMAQGHCQPGPVLSVMDLHWAVSDAYELKIDMVEVSFDGTHFRGKVERYTNDTARILIRAQQSPAFMRFVAVKELCHLMNDEHDDWSSLGVETISGLMRDWAVCAAGGGGVPDPGNPLQSESLAEIGAIELMYPFEYREADLKKLQAGATTIEAIALEHEAPSYAIEQALKHHEIFAEFWNAIEQAKAKAA
jgi:hypothetical protein